MVNKKNFIQISRRKIGPSFPPLIIAELGINHAGSLREAKKLVNLAYLSGCECIKNQTHIIDDEMTPEAKKIKPPNADTSIWEVIKNNSLSLEDEIKLKKYTENLGMIYISTPFSRKAADFLNNINVPAFKIGSGECNHLPLIEHICKFKKPILLSTGMQNIKTIKKSVEIIEAYKIPYCLLECTNIYPSPPEYVSLQGVLELKKTFKNAVIGFSDHSIGPYMSLASIPLGSSLIERHFTDNHYRKGPDISCSMDPIELKTIIQKSHDIWLASNNLKKRTDPEEEVYKFARSSIVIDKNLKKGDILSKKNLWARRPGNGEISVSEYSKLLGKKINKNKKKGEFLNWDDLT